MCITKQVTKNNSETFLVVPESYYHDHRFISSARQIPQEREERAREREDREKSTCPSRATNLTAWVSLEYEVTIRTREVKRDPASGGMKSGPTDAGQSRGSKTRPRVSCLAAACGKNPSNDRLSGIFS